jgi:hypothetical protein
MTRNWLTFISFWCFTGILLPFGSPAIGEDRGLHDSNIVMEFDTAKGGSFALAPVSFGKKTDFFVIDTGATICILDPSLDVGAAVESLPMVGANGPFYVDIQKLPHDLKMEKLLVRPADEQVAICDLEHLRGLSGQSIFGIVGMDFLEKQVLQIDFDQGKLRLLKSAPAGSGEAFPMPIRNHVPYLSIKTPDDREVEFLVDTGMRSSVSVNSASFKGLLQHGLIKPNGTAYFWGLSGKMTSRLAKYGRLSFGAFKIGDLSFEEGPLDMIGLGLLSRFVVTFDFPKQTIYLRKGKSFDRPRYGNLSGLYLLRKTGKTTIDIVENDSVAAAKGLVVDDEIVQIGTSMAEGLSVFEIIEILSQPDQTVRLRIRRNGIEFDVDLSLEVK